MLRPNPSRGRPGAALLAGLVCLWLPATAAAGRFDRPPPSTDFFLRGDTNQSGALEISDAIHLLSFLFTGSSPPSCRKAADSNDDGSIDIGDPIALLSFLFVGGLSPLSPLNGCGVDLTEDGLECAFFPACSLGSMDLHWYRVSDNGTRCPKEALPCFWLTATESGPGPTTQVLLSQLDLTHLLDASAPLTAEEQAGLREAILAARYEAAGFLQEGPLGRQGLGRTLVITSLTILNARQIDLLVTSFEVTGVSFSSRGGGADVTVRCTVYNQGRLDAAAGFDVAVREGAVTRATISFAPLGSGQSASQSRTIHYGSAALGTTVVLRAVVDPANEVEEGSETNNESSPASVRLAPEEEECEWIIGPNGKPQRICF